jgi:hypothetical protein
MPTLASLTGARAFGFSRILALLPGAYATNSATALSKFTFATETPSAMPSLSSATYRSSQGATTNPGFAGYMYGSYSDAGGASSVIDKVTYTSDTTSTLGATMGTAYRSGAYSAHNGNTAGYIFGGYNGGNTTNSEKMTYSSESMSSGGASLSNSRRLGGSATNASSFSYFMGGVDSGYSNGFSTVDKFTFSGESRSTLGTGLNANLGENTIGFSNSGTAGYNSSGTALSGGNGTGMRNINKFSYANDTRTVLSNVITGFPFTGAGFTNHQIAGYVVPNADPQITGDKFSFPTDTKSTISSVMLVNKSYITALSNSL